MEDMVQIYVDPVEEATFIREYASYQFPPLGMACSVDSCPEKTVYTNYGKYIDHYMDKHRPHRYIYKCSLCGKKVSSKNNKKNHK